MEGSVRPADEVVNDEIEEEFQQRNYVSFSQFARGPFKYNVIKRVGGLGQMITLYGILY